MDRRNGIRPEGTAMGVRSTGSAGEASIPVPLPPPACPRMHIGALALAGAAPAAAQSKPEKGTSVGAATTDDPAAERNNFTNHAQDEMRMWEQKLHDYNAKQKTYATEAETSASRNLDSAWTETKTAWTRLVHVGLNVGTAGPNAWASAQADFQTAFQKLALTWQKANPEDK